MQRTIFVAIGLATFVCAASVGSAGMMDAARCKEAKAKAAGKKTSDLLKAFGKNLIRPNPAKLASGISKADSKFMKGFSKAESRGPCETTGDASAIEAKVDGFMGDLLGGILDPCCQSAPGAIGFATIDVGTERPKCGEARNYRCQGGDGDFQNHVCIDDGGESECNFGPCILGPNICAGDFNITCTNDSECTGACVEIASAGFPFEMDCGGLYTGGGLNSVPLPLVIPDMGVTIHAVTECKNGILTLGPARQDDIGPNFSPDGAGLNCTEGKKCDPGTSPVPGGTDGEGLCRIEEDCGCVLGDGCCVEHCLLGPPMPIPNSIIPPISMCVRNVIARDTSGSVDCRDGSADVNIPIAAVVHVTGDLLNNSAPPDVLGLQPCPLCTKVCVGGGNAEFPCVDDSDCDSTTCSGSEQCLGGPNDGNPCTPQTSRLDVHACCANGPNNLQRCGDHADCAPPPGPAPRCEAGFNACTDDSDCTLPNDKCIKCAPGCTSFPTSHDCPPPPGQDSTYRTGGLPIDLTLTDQRQELHAVDMSSNGRRVFCGYCRDGSLCFEGDTDPSCPTAIPPATGNAVPCTSDADCQVDEDEYETCSQKNPGAFSKAATTTVWSQGSTDGQWLSDNECHDATLVGIFCIPPTSDSTIRNACDLPGPGVANVIGHQRLASTPAELDPGTSGTFCGP